MRPISAEKFLAQLRQKNIVDDARTEQINEMRREQPDLLISEAIREMDDLDWEPFLQLLSEEFGCDVLPAEYLSALEPDAETLDRVASHVAQELAIFPLEFNAAKNQLLVVTPYPVNLHVLDDLESALGVDEIQIAFTDEATMANLHQKYYIGSESLLDDDVDEDSGFDIGAASDEEAFPGIYGDAVSDYMEEAEPAKDHNEDDEGVSGSLAHLGLVDMLQALGQSRKTCCIFVESGDLHGSLYMNDGEVIHAETSNAEGEEAAYEILTLTSGHFDIVKRDYSGSPTLNMNVEALLLEGMRRLDEANR